MDFPFDFPWSFALHQFRHPLFLVSFTPAVVVNATADGSAGGSPSDPGGSRSPKGTGPDMRPIVSEGCFVVWQMTQMNVDRLENCLILGWFLCSAQMSKRVPEYELDKMQTHVAETRLQRKQCRIVSFVFPIDP